MSSTTLVWKTPDSEGQENHRHAYSPVDNRLFCVMTQGGVCTYNGHGYGTMHQAQLVAQITEDNRIKKVMDMGDTDG